MSGAYTKVLHTEYMNLVAENERLRQMIARLTSESNKAKADLQALSAEYEAYKTAQTKTTKDTTKSKKAIKED